MILELSEHDALRLLVLTRKEISQANQPWRPYWEHLAQNLQQSIERDTSACRSDLDIAPEAKKGTST